MFTFTKKTDYAMLALSFLATEGVGRVVGPREIARRYEIPGELLAKVMQSLSKRQIACRARDQALALHRADRAQHRCHRGGHEARESARAFQA